MNQPTEHPTEEQKHKDYLEGLKLFYDFQKHLTTLSTGSLLLLATLLDKFFKAPEWRVLIALSFGGFLISMISSALAMYGFAVSVQRSGMPDDTDANVGTGAFIISALAFLTAATCLVGFTLRNFYQ